MKKFSVWTLALFILAIMVVNMGCGSGTRDAQNRVETVLKGITRGTAHGNESISLAMWYQGKMRLNNPLMMGKISDEFDRWRRDGNIFPYIDNYTITGAEQSGASVIVSGTINGESFKMQVVEDVKLRWVQVPDIEQEEDEEEGYEEE